MGRRFDSCRRSVRLFVPKSQNLPRKSPFSISCLSWAGDEGYRSFLQPRVANFGSKNRQKVGRWAWIISVFTFDSCHRAILRLDAFQTDSRPLSFSQRNFVRGDLKSQPAPMSAFADNFTATSSAKADIGAGCDFRSPSIACCPKPQSERCRVMVTRSI